MKFLKRQDNTTRREACAPQTGERDTTANPMRTPDSKAHVRKITEQVIKEHRPALDWLANK